MILVVGSTGSLGGKVTRQLASAGKPVVGLVRDAASTAARALQAAGVKVVIGDLKDRDSIEAALKGVDCIVCTVTSVKSRKDGDSIETVDQKGVQTLLDAAEQAGIRRFIYVSYSKTIPDDMPLSVGKRAAEKRLKTGQWDYTILRPSHFAETWLSPAVGFDIEGGKVRIHGDGKAGISYIAEDDVARGVVACVDNPATVRADIDYGGPEAVSQLEAVALAEQVTRRKIAVEHMSLDQIQAARKAPCDSLTASFLALFEATAKGHAVPTTWTHTLGFQPIGLGEWLRKNYRQ